MNRLASGWYHWICPNMYQFPQPSIQGHTSSTSETCTNCSLIKQHLESEHAGEMYKCTRILMVTSSLKISHWCVPYRQNEHLQDTLPNHPNRQFPSILTSSQAFHRAPPTHNKWQTGRCNTLPPCLLFCLIRPPLGTTCHRYILTSVLWYQTLLYKNTPEDGQINSPKKTNHKNQCHKHCQKN